MDASETAKFLAGELSIPISQLDLSQHLAIIEQARQCALLFLDYAPGSGALGDLVHEYKYRRGVGPKTRVLPITLLDEKQPSTIEGDQKVDKKVEYRLLVTQSGQWVIATLHLQSTGLITRWRPGEAGLVEQATPAKLSTLVQKFPELAYKVPTQLWSLAHRSKLKYEERQDNAQAAESGLDSLLSRITSD